MELPDPVRLRLGNFSRTVFGDSNRTGPEYSEGPGEWPAQDLARVWSLGFCQDLKWQFRLQLVHCSAGSAVEERPHRELRMECMWALLADLLRPGPRIASRAAEGALAVLKKYVKTIKAAFAAQVRSCTLCEGWRCFSSAEAARVFLA